MNIKNSLIVIGFLVITNTIIVWFISNMSDPEEMLSPWFISIILIFPLLFIFNFAARKKLSYKSYFTSKLNFLTSKYDSSITSELSKELMFQKMVEVIKGSSLNLVSTDEKRNQIFATKGITWKSWGENIYIDFTEGRGKTQMNFTSTTVVGIISWGKNEKNYNHLLSTYEESLTI